MPKKSTTFLMVCERPIRNKLLYWRTTCTRIVSRPSTNCKNGKQTKGRTTSMSSRLPSLNSRSKPIRFFLSARGMMIRGLEIPVWRLYSTQPRGSRSPTSDTHPYYLVLTIRPSHKPSRIILLIKLNRTQTTVSLQTLSLAADSSSKNLTTKISDTSPKSEENTFAASSSILQPSHPSGKISQSISTGLSANNLVVQAILLATMIWTSTAVSRVATFLQFFAGVNDATTCSWWTTSTLKDRHSGSTLKSGTDSRENTVFAF